MKTFAIMVNGASVQGHFAVNGNTMWICLQGRTFTIDNPKNFNRKGFKGLALSANPNEIAAPMPGKIIKMMCRAGVEVQANEVLLVMEAMKMEYTVKAPTIARIKEICSEPGQQVVLGQLLVKLEPL